MIHWEAAIQGFKAHLMLERALSPHSLSAYLSDVAKLRSFLDLKGYDYGPTTVTEAAVLELMAYLNSLGLEAASQARILSGLKTFFRYLLLDDYIEKAPTDLIETPRIAQKIPDVLTVEEVDLILSAIDLSAKKGHRDRAILEVLYACGLRVSELIDLKLSKLFVAEKYIIVVGKGNKERVVPIGDTALQQLLYYLKHERGQQVIPPAYRDCIFLNANGKPLSRIWVFKIIKNAAAAAGITKNVSPHTFRHSFATHLIEGGADLKVVQDLLGHESITTTEIYTHLDTAYLRETVVMFHPRNQRRPPNVLSDDTPPQ